MYVVTEMWITNVPKSETNMNNYNAKSCDHKKHESKYLTYRRRNSLRKSYRHKLGKQWFSADYGQLSWPVFRCLLWGRSSHQPFIFIMIVSIHIAAGKLYQLSIIRDDDKRINRNSIVPFLVLLLLSRRKLAIYTGNSSLVCALQQ